jgi:hypothetical protein
MQIAIEDINADKARNYLALNTGNRKLRPNRVRSYAAQMARGLWKETGDPIRFSTAGRLLDGQHRLAAIIAADITVKALVLRDVDESVFPVLDTGMGRQPADALGTGSEHYASHKAAVCRLLCVVENGGDPRRSDELSAVTRIDIADYYASHVEEVTGAVNIGYNMYRIFAGGNRSAWSAFSILAYRIDAEKAEEFLHGVRNGANLTIGDPRLALRNWLSNDRKLPYAGHYLGVLIKTWNSWVTGKHRFTMVIRDAENFPTMLG